MLSRAIASTLLALSFPLTSIAHAAGDDWPHWRGPDGTGVAACSAPTSWSADEGVAWTIEIPGRGVSTPIVLGDKLFLTTAVPSDPEGFAKADAEAAESATGFAASLRAAPTAEHAFVVLCLDARSGEELWRKTAVVATPHEGYHASYGSYASASPVTDGETLYVSFGSQGVFAYDLDGKQLWKSELGTELKMRRAFGEGHAPVIAGDKLVLVCDQEEGSFAVAFDRATGKEAWRVERDEPSAWATPLVTEVDGEMQVVTAATNRVRAYEASTGALVWECAGLGLNTIPTVMRHEDRVLAMSGYRDPKLMAIRLGGKGDLSGGEHVVWESTKGTSYTASPVLAGGRYYTVGDRGFISCFDAASGEPHYLEERLPRGSRLKSSPVAAGDFLYVATEEGDVHVVKLGDELEFAATNSLPGQVFVASPAVAGGRLYLRSLTHLICIGEGGADGE